MALHRNKINANKCIVPKSVLKIYTFVSKTLFY